MIRKNSMATKATVTSPNSSSSLWKYDVFLSFRGEDTRKQVTDHLYHALNQKGIYTFRDDKELKRGKPISPELLKAIEESRFAVVILSKDYASSSWCLEELSKIVECNKVKAQTIIPVFYHVEPTEVRKQTGNYGEAFAKHQQVFKDDMEKVKRWREALTEVASISGWDMKERHEAEAIQEIVKEILRDLNKAFSIGNNELVGMESRTKKMDLLLDIDLNDIRTIGVWGMGGIGKTTVAREVFRKINANFDASCFIDNVREEYEKNGILHLLNLVYKNLVDDEGNVYNYDMGVGALGKRLNSKRVLIILDDVDRLEQIEDLVGRAKYQHNRLGPGSRVIVTTRDKHLLKTYGEEYIYEVEKLNYDESLELLCQKAFKEYDIGAIGAEFKGRLNDVVEYTDGYPLALTILGSFLFGRSVGEWLDTVAKLKKYPDKDILRMLRISLDGLDDNEKSIFLDIACFFRGECEYRVKKILEGCGFYSEIGVKVLIEKSLITMSGDKIWMHDLLHKLGRDIVHQECPEEPGKRSRVWSRKDARHVLVTDTGTEAVQGIFSVRYYGDEVLHLSDKELHLSTNTIGKMKRLRLLRVENACLPEPHGSLSNELRLLEWHRCPLISLPSSFQPSKLVELNLSNSRIERLWKETTIRLEKLILINLTNCKYLKRTPDFSMFPNLERLILEDCKGLSEVHPTIRELKQLVLLNLKGCESLKSLPQGINLKSLETFILSGCTKLDKFPEIVGNMDNLSELYLDTTAIKELPISIKRLTGLVLVNLRDCKNLLSLPNEICCLTSLKTLDVSGCSHLEELPENLGSLEQLVELHANRSAIIEVPSLKNLKKLCFGECSRVAQRSSWQSVICSCFSPKEECISFQLPIALSGFSSLTSLSLRKCNISEGAILEDIGSLSSLQILDLSENNFTSLPETICQLVNLRELSLNQCRSLDSFPRLPLSVRWVNTRDCPRLCYSRNRITLWPSKNGFIVIDGNISDDAKSNIIINDDFDSMLEEHFDSNQHFDSNLYLRYLQGLIYCGKTAAAVLGCNSFPEWCSERRIGSYVYIHLPVENSCETWIGLSLFVDFLTVENANFDGGLDLEKTFCVFSTDGSCRKLFVKSFEGMKLGRNGAVFMYFPRALFAERLKNANRILASVWTARSDIMVKMCGMHLLFNQDVPEFCSRLVLTLGKKLKSRSSIKHFKQILKEECTLEVHANPQKWRNWSSNSSSSGSLQQRCTSTIDSGTTSPLRRNLYGLMMLIVELIHGSYARNYRFTFMFPSKAVPIWFSPLSFGNKTSCELPPNLVDEKQWVGFNLYAALPHPSHDVDHLRVELRCYGSPNILVLVYFNVPVFRNISLVFHAPRVHFPEQLNQCHAVEAFLWTRMTSDVKVQMCGIRIAYEQDLPDAVAMITDIASSGANEHSPQFCIQVGRDFVEVFSSSDDEDADQFGLQILESCFPIYCSVRDYETSMQEILALLKEEKPFVIAEAMIAKGNSKDSKLGFTILKIMAEDALYDSKKWQKGLEELLNCLFGYHVVIALILRGHILSELPPFNPFSSYGFCFPRLEILDWFQDFLAIMPKTVIIKLPPNLNTDNKWCGLAVCASFVVRENPTEFLDNMSTSNNSFRLLCHLKTERCCLHPALISHITKDKFKWLYVGGFIWLIYISSSDLVLPELNEQSYLVVEIYNECINVITRNVAARLMYQQDVGEFGQSITRCVTSLFDNLFLLHQFMVDEEENPVNADETKTSTNGDSYVVAPQEKLIQPSYTGKSEQDFDRLRIYNSCSPHYEILDWFGHHSIRGPSVTIQLPPNVHSDRNWVGLTLCAYFSDLEHTTTVCDNFDPEVPHYLVCFLDAEEVGPQSLHEYQLSNDESKMSHNGVLLWLSYIPRFWFSEQLNHCSHITASFASDRGLRVQNCGLRLLYWHDEEKFIYTINKVENERSKKQYHDGQAVGCSSYTYDHEQESMQGYKNLNPKDKGKRVLQ